MNVRVKEVVEQKNIKYAKAGILWAALAGILYGISPSFQTLALGVEPLSSVPAAYLLLIPLLMACLQDAVSGVIVYFKNVQAGKHKEYLRVLKTKPGKIIVLSSLFGGPFALGTFMLGVFLAGPVYPVAISAMFPAMGAVMARVFLKEKLSLTAWTGIMLCVAGSVTIGWVPPVGDVYPRFYLGLMFAVICAVSWGLELTIGVLGMDFIDPEIALGIREFASSAISFVLLPILAGIGFKSYGLMAETIASMSFVYIMLAGLAAGVSYFFYFKAGNACGASRAMALNPLFTLSASAIGIVFMGSQVGTTFFIGLAILLVGAVLVAGKPAELLTLRDVS
jgi:uncharacterized membrane protein